MGQYKVPQNVEAEDKILGPFSFRQFVYLLIGVAMGAAVYFMGAAFIPLALIPLPICILAFMLALPLRKDQPMETYLIAVFRFFTKSKKRLWKTGSDDTLVEVMAPTEDDSVPLKNLTGTEASQRLSFLSEVIDTGGWSTRGVMEPTGSGIDPDKAAEIEAWSDAHDMFNQNSSTSATIDMQMRGEEIPDIAKQNPESSVE